MPARLTPLLAVLLAGALAGGSAEAQEWPQFRGNPQLTGVATGPVPTDLKLLWSYDAGESIESSAAISGGTVYVGSYAKELLAIDLETGRLRWRYAAADAIAESSPAVASGVVYVGDLAGVLHAVGASEGKPLWTFATEGEIRSSPVVVGDKLLVGSYDGSLYCLSLAGKLLWKLDTANFVHSTPAVAGGVAYFSGCDEVFHGVRLADGKELVDFPSGGYTAASVAFAGQTAFFGTFSDEVLAVDVARQQVLWRYSHPSSPFPFYSSPAVAGDRIVVGGRDRLIHCLNTKTGEALWTFATRARVDSSPAVAAGRVYVGSSDGRLYVLDLTGGKKLWEFDAGAPIYASPAIAAGRVVVGSQDGWLYCFGQSTTAQGK